MFGSKTNQYNPIQLYHLNSHGVRCELMSPDDRLLGGIYYYWLLQIEAEHVELGVIPDNALDLVLSPMIPEFSALYFPVSEKFSIPLDGPVVYVGVCFNVGKVHSIFPMPIKTLKDLSPGKETTLALGLETLAENIQGKSSAESIQQSMDHFFIRLVQSPESTQLQGPPPERIKLLDHLLTTLDSSTIQILADQIGLSERQFRRITSSMFGCSPKKIQRIMRLQSALQELFDSDIRTLSDRYYDDSHRIKELKKLTGLTPGELRRMAENYNQSI